MKYICEKADEFRCTKDCGHMKPHTRKDSCIHSKCSMWGNISCIECPPPFKIELPEDLFD